MKFSGTISRGVRTPIIKRGDDLASIVVESVCNCVNEANLETIDILLEHDIVDKKTVKELVRQGKLVNVNNYDKVLNKY